MRLLAREGCLVFAADLDSGRGSWPLDWSSLQLLSQSVDLGLDRLYSLLRAGDPLGQLLQALFVRLLQTVALHLALADLVEGEIEQRPKREFNHIQTNAGSAFAKELGAW